MREIDTKQDYAALEALEKHADEVQVYAEGLVICAGACWENEPSAESLEHMRCLRLNLDEAYTRLQEQCRQFGIGNPQPRTTTEGVPSTEVAVDSGDCCDRPICGLCRNPMTMRYACPYACCVDRRCEPQAEGPT